MLETIQQTFWSEKFWLPPNITWDQVVLKDKENHRTLDYQIITTPIIIGLAFIIIRIILKKLWFSPVGISLGVKEKKLSKPEHIPLLENAYMSNKNFTCQEIKNFSKKLDWSEQQVQRWLRRRKCNDKLSTLDKFCENSWRTLYYTFIFAYGMIYLWKKPWFWNINVCWKCYPFQMVARNVWWHYMLSLGFYWSLSISQFYDNKRTDFWVMFIHHIATICLMSFSWICNFVRIGTLVLITHDCADIFMETAKLAKYAGYEAACNYIFTFFAIIWISTRMIIFPYFIIGNIVFEARKYFNTFPAFYLFVGLLLILLLLHIFWTYLILKISYKALKAKHVEGDIRSSTDCSNADSQD